MKQTRIVFMGTPDFACGILQALIDYNYHVVGVVSQPDKKVGRKQILTPTPVKMLALENAIPVVQPFKIKEDFQMVLDLKPDLIVTCAYGQIVPDVILNAPKLGCVNVHASLLPKYRGGAPIHWAVINGESESGVTIMKMVSKMDAGEMYLKKVVAIEPDDTTSDLYGKLKEVGAQAIIEYLKALEHNEVVGEPQSESEVTYAYNISKQDEFVSFVNRDIDTIYNHIRGLISIPVGYGIIDKKRIKLHSVKKMYKQHHYPAGTVTGFNEDGMCVAVDGGFIVLVQLQLEGKSKMMASDFQNGYGNTLVQKRFE